MTQQSNLYPKNYGASYENIPPDLSRCCESVRVAGLNWPKYNQCSRKRGHGPDGAYCKQHDPEAVKARDEVSRQRSQEQWNARRLEWHGKEFFEALVKIADGYNDARGLAEEIVSRFRKGST